MEVTQNTSMKNFNVTVVWLDGSTQVFRVGGQMSQESAVRIDKQSISLFNRYNGVTTPVATILTAQVRWYTITPA